jgi:hypothetical protein
MEADINTIACKIENQKSAAGIAAERWRVPHHYQEGLWRPCRPASVCPQAGPRTIEEIAALLGARTGQTHTTSRDIEKERTGYS